MKSHICGTPDINCDDFIDRKQARFMGLNAKYAYIAMQQAGQLTTTLTLTLSLILTLTPNPIPSPNPNPDPNPNPK